MTEPFAQAGASPVRERMLLVAEILNEMREEDMYGQDDYFDYWGK